MSTVGNTYGWEEGNSQSTYSFKVNLVFDRFVGTCWLVIVVVVAIVLVTVAVVVTVIAALFVVMMVFVYNVFFPALVVIAVAISVVSVVADESDGVAVVDMLACVSHNDLFACFALRFVPGDSDVIVVVAVIVIFFATLFLVYSGF